MGKYTEHSTMEIGHNPEATRFKLACWRRNALVGVIGVFVTLVFIMALIMTVNGEQAHPSLVQSTSQMRLEPSGLFSLSSQGQMRLQGWLLPGGNRKMPSFEPVQQTQCVKLNLPVGSSVHFSVASGGWWYGGPELARANWPINPTRIKRQRFVSSDMLGDRSALGSVLEAMWITSSGASIRLLDANAFEMSLNVPCEGEVAPALGKLCFVAHEESGVRHDLSFELCAYADALSAQLALLASLPRPLSLPSSGIIRAPIWSTCK